MTQVIDRVAAIAGRYDALVFDQWGVLHNGQSAYGAAVHCIEALHGEGAVMAVLSNSGKRAAPNAQRIAAMGFDSDHFKCVMTSGEALWQEVRQGQVPARRFFPIERHKGDAVLWAEGLEIAFCDDISNADAVLLMGLPDGTDFAAWEATLQQCLERRLPLYCTNPDKASPRGSGYVMSPGVLADFYQGQGGTVRFYGKPHQPVFKAIAEALGGGRILMIGDSLEHDIAGAQNVGWDSLLIQGGLYARDFAAGPAEAVLEGLVQGQGIASPTYRMEVLA